MNALVVDPATGFLESSGYGAFTFDGARKRRYIDLAEEHFAATGTMPDLVSLAAAVGVCPRTVDNHLKEDDVFAAAWRNIRLKGKWKLESKMYEYGLTKSGYMDRITWLRKEFPEEYNPDLRIISSTDFTVVKGKLANTQAFIDAETVETPITSTQTPETTTSGPKAP